MGKLREILENVSKQCRETTNCMKCKLHSPRGCIFVGIINNTKDVSEECINLFVEMHTTKE